MFRIRSEQKSAFRVDALRDFERRVLMHMDRCFPERRTELGDVGALQMIRLGTERAAAFGIENEQDVCKFIDLMLVFGADFDQRRDWAREVLNAESPRDPFAKMRLLYARALEEE